MPYPPALSLSLSLPRRWYRARVRLSYTWLLRRHACIASYELQLGSSYKCHVSEQDVLNSLSHALGGKRENKGQGQRTDLETEAGV